MKEIEYRKCRTTANIGETVEIPGHAEAVTIANFSPSGTWAQISWLEPIGGDDRGTINQATIQAISSHYADDDPVRIPGSAWAVSVYEPLESSETVVYYLQ